MFPGFLEKVKSGKEKVAGSGFGGKGLDRLDQERDAKEKAERKSYGEPEEEKAAAAEGTTTTETMDEDGWSTVTKSTKNVKNNRRGGGAPARAIAS